MIFLGSYPIPAEDGTMVRVKIRNRPGRWVVMDPIYAHVLRRHDIYMDHTKAVYAQPILGLRIPLSQIGPYKVISLVR